MKTSNDTLGNRTHDLSACSAVPQPTAPPLSPLQDYACLYIYVGYSESKYRLRISLTHPRYCYFAHVQ